MRLKLLLGSTLALGVLVTSWAVVARGQTPPAPLVDRVEFPEGYRTSYTPLFTFDRPDVRQIRVVYGNPEAAAVIEEVFRTRGMTVLSNARATAARRTESGAVVDLTDGRLVEVHDGRLVNQRRS